MKARKLWTRKILAVWIALSLLFAGSAVWNQQNAYAAEQDTISVYVTLSERGEIALADGQPMADVPVKVKADNGTATVDDVMEAFHQLYKPGEYTCDQYVTQLWGIETSNTLFFINDLALTSGVQYEPVKDGDHITASVNADDRYYADYYCSFDRKSVTAVSGDTVTLKLTGYMGMSEEKTPVSIANAQIGVITDQGFRALEGIRTDENGNFTVRLSKEQYEPGKTYILSAIGTVKTTVTDWSAEGMPSVEVEAPLIAPACILKIESGIVAGVKNTKITSVKAKASKGSVLITWKKSAGYKVDCFQIFRSVKKDSGYGNKAYFTTKHGGLNGWYRNTKSLKKGNRYYYKVRGVRVVDGEKIYTNYSVPVGVTAK